MSWSIPTTRVNGTALNLSELSSYEIYYVNDATPAVGKVVAVSGGGTVTYTIAGIAPGTYHFSISAIDSTGLKSSLSSVVDATFGP